MKKPEPIDYDTPATTDGERRKLARARARDLAAMMGIRSAARALVNDARRRNPGEDLRCPFMRALDAALMAELEIDKKVIRQLYGCLLYTSPSPRDGLLSRMPSSA